MESITITNQRDIKVQSTKYKGRDVLDVRTYIKTSAFEGFTKKGITIPIEFAPLLAEAIQKVYQEYQEKIKSKTETE